MTDIAALNARFGSPGTISFSRGPGGLAIVEVTHRLSAAKIALQGAHLFHWAPRDERDVIWLSSSAIFAPGKAIRGGIPICWPWFGAHPDQPSWPAHGFARTSPWILETVDSNSEAAHLRFRALRDPSNEALWPGACSLTLDFHIGRTLQLGLTTHNIGVDPMTITEALHSYFHVGDVSRIRVLGLDGQIYIDKVNTGSRHTQVGPVTIADEIDRIYTGVRGECVIEDPSLGRVIRISKSGSDSTVIWNPWEAKASRMDDFTSDAYLRMVCVETANAAENSRTISPGATHTLGLTIQTKSLD